MVVYLVTVSQTFHYEAYVEASSKEKVHEIISNSNLNTWIEIDKDDIQIESINELE